MTFPCVRGMQHVLRGAAKPGRGRVHGMLRHRLHPRSTRLARTVAALAIALAVSAACGDGDASQTAGTGGSGSTPATGDALPEGCAAADGSAPTVTQFTDYPPNCLRDGATYQAVIVTNQGTFHVDLLAGAAPLTVNSFVNLARYHYFDGTTCHRAIQNFVVQCGDPTGTGRGGPGYRFADETDGQAAYRLGSVAMANSGADTNGSQFFIITGDDGALLPPNYTLFGQVADDDLGLVAQLNLVANPNDGPPLQPIDIESVTIQER